MYTLSNEKCENKKLEPNLTDQFILRHPVVDFKTRFILEISGVYLLVNYFNVYVTLQIKDE